jgi:hypothetical protein
LDRVQDADRGSNKPWRGGGRAPPVLVATAQSDKGLGFSAVGVLDSLGKANVIDVAERGL